ncbi:MAG: hypothetical protein JO246_13150 [Frankiaceae bacterium]|nr:hypothetical protein [Frankiaceae bacterium]MBV9871023.1 hypothetical protein [Frankiaceae bacterium]
MRSWPAASVTALIAMVVATPGAAVAGQDAAGRHAKHPHLRGTVVSTSGNRIVGAPIYAGVRQSGVEQLADFFCFFFCGPAHTTAFSTRHGHFSVRVPHPNPAHDGYVVAATVPKGNVTVSTAIAVGKRARHGAAIGHIVTASGRPKLRKSGMRRHVRPPPLPVRFRPTDFAATARPASDAIGVAFSSFDATDGFDVRLLEDERFRITTSQTGSEHGRAASFGSTLTVKGDHVPGSRHDTCLVENHRGGLIRQHDCGLTDGVLDSEWSPKDDPACSRGPCKGHKQHHHRDVFIRLHRPVNAALVVVRGCLQDCKVAVKSRGSSFTTVAKQVFGSAGDFVFADLHGRRVATVRIQTPTGGFFDRLREVSVFGH